MNIEKLIRPSIYNLEPYSSARDEYNAAEFQAAASVFLDANESPYANGYNRYPDPRQRALKQRIAELKGIAAENIFVGNGSDEAIDLLYRVFCEPALDNAVAITPSYGMYGVAAAMNNVEFREVPLTKDFALDTDALLAASDSHTKLMFICSPNNPTGNAFSFSELKPILNNFEGIVVVDEAYIDFTSDPSLISKLPEYPNLVILQTFSKAWGMAGLRVGLALASEEIIEIMSRVKYPYNISGLVQNVVLQSITAEHAKNKEAQVVQIKSERAMVANELEKTECIEKVYPSEANFILVKVKGSASEIYDKLLKAGVIVRNRSKLYGCANCLRLTIGTPEENELMIRVLQDRPYAALQKAPERYAKIERKTNETDITVELSLGNQQVINTNRGKIDTGLHFFNHMLDQIAHHGGVYLNIIAKGDLEVDEHHTIEDVGIVLGQAIDTALGSKVGIERYGFALPMDECNALVLLDFGGRIDFSWDVGFKREMIGDVPTEMFRHFFASLCHSAKCNLHITATGENEHHKIEAVFKAFARALKQAASRSPFPYSISSSKGIL